MTALCNTIWAKQTKWQILFRLLLHLSWNHKKSPSINVADKTSINISQIKSCVFDKNWQTDCNVHTCQWIQTTKLYFKACKKQVNPIQSSHHFWVSISNKKAGCPRERSSSTCAGSWDFLITNAEHTDSEVVHASCTLYNTPITELHWNYNQYTSPIITTAFAHTYSLPIPHHFCPQSPLLHI